MGQPGEEGGGSSGRGGEGWGQEGEEGGVAASAVRSGSGAGGGKIKEEMEGGHSSRSKALSGSAVVKVLRVS